MTCVLELTVIRSRGRGDGSPGHNTSRAITIFDTVLVTNNTDTSHGSNGRHQCHREHHWVEPCAFYIHTNTDHWHNNDKRDNINTKYNDDSNNFDIEYYYSIADYNTSNDNTSCKYYNNNDNSNNNNTSDYYTINNDNTSNDNTNNNSYHTATINNSHDNNHDNDPIARHQYSCRIHLHDHVDKR